jgi:hypothetical protein
MTRRRFGLFGVIVALLVVVYAVAWGTKPGQSAVSAGNNAVQTVGVTAVTRSCPPPGAGAGRANIALVSVPSSVKSAAATGNATLSAIPSAVSKPASQQASHQAAATTVTTPDVLTALPAPQAAEFGGTQINATGQLAAGLEAEQSTANGTGTLTCAHPGADMWFVGTGQEAGASDIWLYLTNTGVMAASVDVTLLTDAGVQNGLAGGITVPAHQYVSVNLAQYVKGSSALAVRVQTSSGQVAANVWEDGGGSSGGAWLPLAASAGTQLVIPGLTAAGSAAKLFVAVPGPDDAQLKVTALTAQGKFQPFGGAAVDAPSGAASSFPLSALGASPAALVITSNVPVTAGVLVPGHGIGGFTAAVAPVTEQGVVAGNPASGGLTTGLVLSAPAGAVRVSVRVLPSTTAERSPLTPQPQFLTIEAGHTLAAEVSPPKGDTAPFAIVVTPQPGSGPLYAARVVTSGGSLSGTLQSVLPVPSALTTITLPSARDTYSAVLP